jgi:electron transfer flavoprotein alpha subunit
MSVVVLVETDADGPTTVSLETLTFARELARRSGAQVHAVAVAVPEGGARDALLARLGEQGVTSAHCAKDDRLQRYAAAAWAAAVVDVVGAVGARAVLAPGSPRGNEVLAHVATRLELTMAANAVRVESTDPLIVTRQVLGGAALERMRLDGPVVALSVAGHACEPGPADEPVQTEFVDFAPTITDRDLAARVSRVEAGAGEDTAALTTARVVVGAGRGAGGADRFADLLELTALLGGALGVSRVVTSLGWRPHSEQVGQTGSRISPELYLACGISGAIQHWAGCQSAKTIVAINTDPEAPMVTKADYAVIGDLHEVVPAITAELRKRRGSAQ